MILRGTLLFLMACGSAGSDCSDAAVTLNGSCNDGAVARHETCARACDSSSCRDDCRRDALDTLESCESEALEALRSCG